MLHRTHRAVNILAVPSQSEKPFMGRLGDKSSATQGCAAYWQNPELGL